MKLINVVESKPLKSLEPNSNSLKHLLDAKKELEEAMIAFKWNKSFIENDIRQINYDGKNIFDSMAKNGTEAVNRYNAEVNALLKNYDIESKHPLAVFEQNSNRTPKISLLEDSMVRYNTRRYANLSELMKVADLLGFVIIPFESADESIYSCDPVIKSWSIENKIRKFITDDPGVAYILCPINYYSLLKHSKAENYYADVYFSKKLEFMKMIVLMSIPVFRSVFSQLTNHENRINKLELEVSEIKTQADNLEQNLILMQNQLDALNNKIVEERELIIKQAKEINKLKNVAIESARHYAQMYDPLIFKSKNRIEDFSKDQIVQLGFSWGTDIPAGLLEVLVCKPSKIINPIDIY